MGSQKLGGTKFVSKKMGRNIFLFKKYFLNFKLWANKNYNKFDGGKIFFKNSKF